MRAQPARADVVEPALELAEALEAVVPDRTHAIEMYLVAWKAGRNHPQALARARQLAREIGNLELAAKIARNEHKHGGDPRAALAEGLSWLDADQPDQAVRPLLAAVKADPGDAVAQQALAAARREWPNVRAELDRLEAAGEAAADPHAGALCFLQAARILHMLKTDDERYERVLRAAFLRCPADESAYGMLERRYAGARDWDRLLATYRARAEAAPSDREVIDVYRRAGTRLILRDAQAALGATLLGKALERGYDQRLEDVPGHVAMVALLRRALGRDTERLLPLLRRALESGASDDDRVGVAVIALDFTWNELSSAGQAYPFAAFLAEHASEHPTLARYQSGGGMALGQLAGKLATREPAPVSAEALALIKDQPWTQKAPPPPVPGAAAAPALAPLELELEATPAAAPLELEATPVAASPSPAPPMVAPAPPPAPPAAGHAAPAPALPELAEAGPGIDLAADWFDDAAADDGSHPLELEPPSGTGAGPRPGSQPAADELLDIGALGDPDPDPEWNTEPAPSEPPPPPAAPMTAPAPGPPPSRATTVHAAAPPPPIPARAPASLVPAAARRALASAISRAKGRGAIPTPTADGSDD